MSVPLEKQTIAEHPDGGAKESGSGGGGDGAGSGSGGGGLSGSAGRERGTSPGRGISSGSVVGGGALAGGAVGGIAGGASARLLQERSAAAKEKADKPSGLGRVFNPPKLERKHSSGDLHSRLKTRKILGVGETDNGDIHRSKISQVLGHNEHLYVRLPRGFWTFHVLLGVGVTLEALTLLFSPAMAASMGLLPYPTELHTDALLAARLLGAALAGMAVFMWSLLGTSDKHYARTLLLSLLTYQLLAVVVAGCSGAYSGVLLERRTLVSVGVRIGVGLLSLLYFYKIACYYPIRGHQRFGMGARPSASPHSKDN